MPNILWWVLPVVIVGGGYLYNAWLSRRGGLEQSMAEVRVAGRPAPRAGLSPRSVLLFILGLTLFFLALRLLDRYAEARHPAVKEHRAALIELASKRMGCPMESLTMLAEDPMRARVGGCGRVEIFRWGKSPRGVRTWNQIDPNCTIEIMGYTRPCD